jgi:hypothetical protein
MNTEYNCKMNYIKKRKLQNINLLKEGVNKTSDIDNIVRQNNIIEEQDFLILNYFIVILFILFLLIKWNIG